jgi:septal ring factor EnvC (AmiA/AmiB activator)
LTESRCFSLVAVLVATATVGARVPDSGRTEALARRVADRVAVLQREADRLARQARTLLGDVRRLEIERDMAVARLSAAEAAAEDAAADVEIVTERLAAVEQERVNALPDLKGRFVELYKHRRGGYARMLLGVRDMREFGRATRAVASLAHLNQQRIDRHRRTLAELREERARADEKRRDLRNKQALARKALRRDQPDDVGRRQKRY